MEKKIKDKQSFLRTAIKRFGDCIDATMELRKDFVDDIKNLTGDQWDEYIRAEREQEKRPALTVNRLQSAHNMVVNDFKQNRPNVKFRPVDSDTDPDKADVLNGLLRRIQNNGDSRTAFDTAFYYASGGGFGFVRVKTDWSSDMSLDQEIFIEKIDNPCSVYFPVNLCEASDYSDAPYCFIRFKMSKEDFKEKYPNASENNFEKIGEGDSNFQTSEDFLILCEYFFVEEKIVYLVLLSDGTTHTVEEQPAEGQLIPNTNLTVIKSRETIERVVKRCIVSEFEILEEPQVFPGRWIPIVPMLGQEINIEGKKSYVSLIRSAKDPQKMLNYWNSAFTEQIALSPKAPYLIADGQIEGYEDIWREANTKNFSFLPYRPMSSGGQMVSPPMRVQPPTVGSAIITGIQYATDNLKATTGIYDASLGAQGNETSGRAISARQRQGSTANFHFTDNASRCLRHVGRIIKDLIPIIYDTPDRVVRIVGEDMADKVFTLNRTSPDKNGQLYDLSIGDYDVIVDIGPAYETKRIEMVETLTALAQSNPIYGQVAPDLLVQNLDFAGKDELTKRIKKYLTMQMPQLFEGEEKDDEEEQLQQAQLQVQQMTQQLQQAQQQIQADQEQMQKMNQAIQQLSKTVNDLQIANQNKQGELAVKMQIEQMKAELEQMKIKADIDKTLINAENRTHNTKLSISGDMAKEAQKKLLNQGDVPKAIVIEEAL